MITQKWQGLLKSGRAGFHGDEETCASIEEEAPLRPSEEGTPLRGLIHRQAGDRQHQQAVRSLHVDT
jgi:hypothetical protein